MVEERSQLARVIDGDAFFPLKRWPKDMHLIFWKKTTGDTETLKLILFLLGNGCAPTLIAKWIMLAQQSGQSPSFNKAEKRARHVDFAFINADTKKHV